MSAVTSGSSSSSGRARGYSTASGSSSAAASSTATAAAATRASSVSGAPDRRALPIAGDDAAARQQVIAFLDEIGYDSVDAGLLAESWRFERGMPGYCIPLRRSSMAGALLMAEKGQRVPDGSWRTPRDLA